MYEGDFADDERHGKGKLLDNSCNPGTYEGDFAFGGVHGKGKWDDKYDGGTYEGDFADGKFHGKGKWISKNEHDDDCIGNFINGVHESKVIPLTDRDYEMIRIRNEVCP